ncbi:helix-hairpin-helix domain-containing protein [Faecalicatena contorta]|uniref:helix-hairpin-helix domain-containing protein n=1 Tax=Faecalicatena contorta TaxID=39482 RepID=UPI0019600ED9|nr:helix-hairpin-helix domain-containing protein [Faecalicatena contorta]MBM6685237.1 helix-hairpin-helix domain-containing protein [Faecalicatena contorta]MBM6710782.1 helix-hairpin-helix domain-containing protein [Faecalicatena contorta]
MRRRLTAVLWILVILTGCLNGCEKKEETSGIEEISLEEDGEEASSGEEDSPEKTGEETREKGQEPEQETDAIFVYVCGQVAAPGVYELSAGARVYQAIERAGGTLEGASPESLNLAQQAEDGQKIYVPSKEEAEAGTFPQDDSWGATSSSREQGGGKVNLNTAGLEELMTLTGIGQTRAEAIITYREEEGAFQAPEDIMKVDGIKEGIYEKLKDEITV